MDMFSAADVVGAYQHIAQSSCSDWNTAGTGLEEAGRLKRGDTVLVTAAAGGTGQFAVQLAAAAGCTVVATCGSAAKADLLRRLGAARVINYREERVKDVLKREYPQARAHCRKVQWRGKKACLRGQEPLNADWCLTCSKDSSANLVVPKSWFSATDVTWHSFSSSAHGTSCKPLAARQM